MCEQRFFVFCFLFAFLQCLPIHGGTAERNEMLFPRYFPAFKKRAVETKLCDIQLPEGIARFAVHGVGTLHAIIFETLESGSGRYTDLT